MKLASYIFILFILISFGANAVDIKKIHSLQDKQEIESAVKIKDEMKVVQNGIEKCIERGGTHESCICENEELSKQLSNSIKQALKKTPKLAKNRVV